MKNRKESSSPVVSKITSEKKKSERNKSEERVRDDQDFDTTIK